MNTNTKATFDIISDFDLQTASSHSTLKEARQALCKHLETFRAMEPKGQFLLRIVKRNHLSR